MDVADEDEEQDIFGSGGDDFAEVPCDCSNTGGQMFQELAPQLDEFPIPIVVETPKRHPEDPTRIEKDAHRLTHANYRSWRAICNRAALAEGPRYKQAKDEIGTGFVCISFDYKIAGDVIKETMKSYVQWAATSH